ncbi:2-dehydro-3-deoxygluconokinase [Mesobacillus campisalis]|uniref:2-dehydro-3-deoxygluconokinase n=1 Tax=Mesobacillus campisalis TaxID=1408103 RepID=A0A0M2SRL7_9BACI|nr:sugar kinase [Mesobacillus campisalis]KKK36798.1 2-dehydro-3-deoxygluconokinase [Mesobacillus campisalis]
MDVITFGETMVLFTPVTAGPLRFTSHFQKTIGGAESNVAIALSRLGHKVGWTSRLGKDEFGTYIRNYIRGEGVDTTGVVFDHSRPTGVFFKEQRPGKEPNILYYRKGSAASRMTPSDIPEAQIKEAKFLHLTGITPALSESCKETVHHAISIAKQNGVKVIFDPNLRLKLWSAEEAREALVPIVAQCDYILPGLEEGSILTGKTEPEDIASFFLENGSSFVVVKLGEKGAYFASEAEEAHVPGFPVTEIVDPIGAGDGFAAGFLSGLLRNWPVKEAVALGNKVGAYALSVAGDAEGYPNWEQIIKEKADAEVLR